MNFLALEYFLAVAAELNITKAAERLYISQQSLSHSIIKLEKYLGASLFNRTPALSLTYAGSRLVAAANQIMDIKQRILNEFDDINNNRRGELKIGISHTRGCAVLPDILPDYRKNFPLIEVSLIEGNNEILEEALNRGTIDLLFGSSTNMPDYVETVELTQERLFLVVPSAITNNTFGDKSDFMRGKFSVSADISVFKDCPFLMLKEGNRVRAVMDEYLNSKGIRPDIILEADNIETVFALAVKGMGITVYPEMFFKRISGAVLPVDIFPLTEVETTYKLNLCYSRKRYLSQAAKEFIALSVQKFSGGGAGSDAGAASLTRNTSSSPQ